jgi:putative FmdB family regulatory protein
MPWYEYECVVCGHRFDGTAKVADPNPACPKVLKTGEPCAGAVRKVISRGSFHLKGKGWASDGYT